MVNYGLLGGITAALVALITFGLPWFFKEYFPWQYLRRQRFATPEPTTKSYKGRTALITGANGAYGSRAAKVFGLRDIETLILVDVMDCAGVKAEIEAELKELKKPVPNILVWKVDMMSFASCQEFGRKAKELKHLDHVLLTAGILSFKRRESPEGWETTIQVNYLASALIGLLLLPVLKASPSNPNPPILTFVTTFGIYPSSFTMSMPKTGSYIKKLSNNKDGMEQAHQYGRSKALLLYFTRELAARAAKAENRLGKVTVNSADPGSAWTALTNPNQEQLIPRLIMNFGARDPKYGAVALANGASAGADGHGKIMHDFDDVPYPPFMSRKSGLLAQQCVWEETREEFEAKVPDVKAVYKILDAEK